MERDGLTEEQRRLLQRYFDREVTERERERAETLLEREASAETFVYSLGELRGAARAAMEQAWARIEAQMPSPEAVARAVADAPEIDELSLEALAPLLERFHDGEVTDAEAEVVAQLRKRRDDVADYLAMLEGIGVGARAADEALHERADDANDFGADFWAGIEEGIDAVDAERETGTVVSLDERRREDSESPDAEDETESWWNTYKQGVVGAVAASAMIAGLLALFGDGLFEAGQRVIERKTVVIVDSVQYQQGSSVLVNSPVAEAGRQAGDDEEPGGAENDDGEQPTVIWLLDEEQPSNGGGAGDKGDSPAKDGRPAPDGGSIDGGSIPGQPI